MREARRPFSSFIRRLLSGPDESEERSGRVSEKEQPQPDEQPEEFWNPKLGAPPTELIRPMRPQFPVWKKDIPGLTDPYLEEDEWQDQWMSQRQRRGRRNRRDDRPQNERSDEPVIEDRGSPHNPEPYADQRAQNERFSPLSVVQGHHYEPRQHQAESVGTMEERPEKQDNLDAVVDRLLRDRDFLLAEELKNKAEEINQLLVQAQRQKMKVELDVTALESRPGNKVSWLDIKIFKEI